MPHAVSAARVLAVLACAQAFAPFVLAQEEGGGIGGSLVSPAISPRRPKPSPAEEPRSPPPRAPVERGGGSGTPAIYSYPINTEPDGWAALKAEPSGGARRLTKVYDGTLFLVVGRVPGWKLVQFRSGERGWIAERLVGCCRPASH